MIIYVDPGSGLFLLQAAVSVVLGGLFMARSKIRELRTRIVRMFRRRPDDAQEPGDADAPE